MERFLKRVTAVLLVLAVLVPSAAVGTHAKGIAGSMPILSSAHSLRLREDETNTQVPFAYSDAYFDQSGYVYSHALARISLRVAAAAFSAGDGLAPQANLAAAFALLGFAEERFINFDAPLTDESDKVAYGIAQKSLAADTTLLLLAVRGGGYGGEWVSNGNVGDAEAHAGFLEASKEVIAAVRGVIESLAAAGQTVKVWLTGFSRGAAVLDLTAAALDRYAESSANLQAENLYAYLFATPQVTRDADCKAARYDNIFHIINSVDVVMAVPFRKWGYNRHGQENFIRTVRTDEAVYEELQADFAALFAGTYEGTLPAHIIPWQQYLVLYMIAKAIPAFLPSNRDMLTFQEPMKNIIRELFVTQNLHRNLADGNWLGIYQGLFAGENMERWNEVYPIVEAVLSPVNWVASWFSASDTPALNPQLPAMLIATVSLAIEALQAEDEEEEAEAAAPAPTSEPFDWGALWTFLSLLVQSDLLHNFSMMNFTCPHSPESYIVLLDTFGAGEAYTDGSYMGLDLNR
ncbi:MAG: hypothetical protein LBR73_09245 [Oscillospiraceae bacterium]|jgi:hypothetical protein|nr:hypothetical protein [Oscillospiraceae bacterium]